MLYFSGGSSSSRWTARATVANASLTSKRSTSSTRQPVCSRTRLTATTGAMVNHSGSRLKGAPATSRVGTDQQRRDAVVDAGGVARGDRALGAEVRLEAAELGLVELAGALVDGE